MHGQPLIDQFTQSIWVRIGDAARTERPILIKLFTMFVLRSQYPTIFKGAS